MRQNNATKRTGTVLAGFGLLLASVVLAISPSVHAEGTGQFNEQQKLEDGTAIFADILNSGETINISFCQDADIAIYDINDTPMDEGDDTLVDSTTFVANLVCVDPMPNPVTGAYKFTPAEVGTYRIAFLSSDQERYDISVTPNNVTDPDPTEANGRIWSYEWNMDAIGSYDESESTDVDLYALVPGPNDGEDFVWKLDLNNFAGNVYDIAANSKGLDPPYSGISASDSASYTPEYPVYMGYPAIAGSANTSTPTVGSPQFTDDEDEDAVFSPNGTPGVQDTGNFTFNSNVDNATYAITIDTNQDGEYGTGDRLLLGNASLGANTVNWDGTYPNGDPVDTGTYTARIQIRIGEFHFIASDVETSGGTSDGGLTWNNGLTIYRAINASTDEDATVYWDDLTELSSYDDATANVPNGVTSGSSADENEDGKPDGYHIWGDFTGSSLGDENNIDTYVFGATGEAEVTITVAPDETGDDDGVSIETESGAPNLGDGNGDGTEDYLQDNVTSLVNPVTGGYGTLVSGGGSCESLSSVSVKAESELSATDPSKDYPVGLFNFSVNCLAPGGTAQITVFYDRVYDTTNWVARKFTNGAYSDISGATFSTAVVGGNTVTTMSYNVTDGSSLDADGSVNGVIVDPAGPGVAGAVSAPSTGIRNVNSMISAVSLGAGILMVGYGMQRRRLTDTHSRY